MVRKRSTKIRPTPHGARSAPIFPRAAPGTHGRTRTRQEEPGLPRPGRPASGGGVREAFMLNCSVFVLLCHMF